MNTPTLGEQLNREFDAWFLRLQALTDDPLDPEAWTGRWFDGYAPEEAIAVGPDED